MRRGLAQLLPHLYSLLRECRTKFPDKVLGVLNIDLAKRVIQYLTGVATGSNAQQKHTPQTKVAGDAGCRSTLRTHNRLLLRMEGNRNAVHRNAQVKRQNEALQPFYGKCAVKFLTISIQNANLARAEARSALRVINCLLLT
jgi:hypothetical protein